MPFREDFTRSTASAFLLVTAKSTMTNALVLRSLSYGSIDGRIEDQDYLATFKSILILGMREFGCWQTPRRLSTRHVVLLCIDSEKSSKKTIVENKGLTLWCLRARHLSTRSSSNSWLLAKIGFLKKEIWLNSRESDGRAWQQLGLDNKRLLVDESSKVCDKLDNMNSLHSSIPGMRRLKHHRLRPKPHIRPHRNQVSYPSTPGLAIGWNRVNSRLNRLCGCWVRYRCHPVDRYGFYQ